MHFRKGRTPQTQYDFKVGDNSLEIVDQYKYLGVIFQEKNNFRCNADTLAKAAGRALGSVINKVHGLKACGFRTYEKLYNACVVPVLDYGSSVWGHNHYQSTDNIQNRALRYFLGVCRFAPTLALYGDTGWIPCTHRRWCNMLRYWNRLIKMDDSRLTKRAFLHDYTLCSNNWCSEVKEIMCKLNLTAQFNSKQTVNLVRARDAISQYYGAQWSRDIQTQPKLRTYRVFKTTFKCEDYVTMDLIKHERSILTQFRCGILPIRIETGRYVGEAPDQRLCVFCNRNAVEDERHLLFFCDMYNELRSQVFGDIIDRLGSVSVEDKLTSLVTNHVRKTARFLTKAYTIRRTRVYSRN